LAVVALGAAAVTFVAVALLTNIFERKHTEVTVARVVELTDTTYDAATWGLDYPAEYDGFLATANFTASGHSTALVPAVAERVVAGDDTVYPDSRDQTTASKLVADPRLVTLWKGYAFAIDYRHLRGHQWMLTDQRETLRVLARQQPGACLNCHASTLPVMEELGQGDIEAGFAAMNKLPYAEAAALAEHPVQCVDCHDPETMALRVTRPALANALTALKASQGIADYDVNRDASSEELRSYVCAQCHVEYYFAGEGKTLTFPWADGLDINAVWQYYSEVENADGTTGFTDFTHAITGAGVVKAQHPEFETWSAGVHAANGVSCADCHMAYQTVNSQKVANHQVTNPMADPNASCGACHSQSEAELRQRVDVIQNRFVDSRDRALDALTQLIDNIGQAQGVSEAQLDLARQFQNKASFYVDYAYSENSYGFHAPDYLQRILSQSLDAARQGQLALLGMTAEQLAASDVALANAEAADGLGI
jgi:nitrite reductase (cytochrome c-552)